MPIVSQRLQTEDALKLFSEHKTHARHLENYLLSFTQVFLLVTGALWGYALARNGKIKTGNLELVGLIFGFHLFYSLLGALFTVRLSTNFRAHYEAGDTSLKDAGLGKYVVLIPPENAEGTIETDRPGKLFRLLRTAKAFFLFIYVIAAGVDAYYLSGTLSEETSKTVVGRFLPGPFFSLVLVVVSFLGLAWVAYRACTKRVSPADSALERESDPVPHKEASET